MYWSGYSQIGECGQVSKHRVGDDGKAVVAQVSCGRKKMNKRIREWNGGKNLQVHQACDVVKCPALKV